MRFHRETVTVEEALGSLLARATALPVEQVELYQAHGRILGKDLHATCDLPPFDRSPLDGFAVRAVDTAMASPDHPIYLQVIETVAAGEVPKKVVQPGTACRIMTGALLPQGADAVIMFEQTVNPGELSSTVGVKRALESGENISRKGEELKESEPIARAGEDISAGNLALLATFGYAQVPVVRKPRVGILSTGHELISYDQPLFPGKIRDSNKPMLYGMISEAGGIPMLFPTLSDDVAIAKRVIAEYIEEVDVLITTGGVSVGDFDILASLVDDAEFDLLFNRVAMRPGSPTTVALYHNKILCGLSGNPGACFLGFELFVRPLLKQLLGRRDARPISLQAVLGTDFTKPCPYPRYLRGKLQEQETRLYAYPDFNAKAGNLGTLKESECLIVIPAGGKGKKAGELVQVIPHRAASWSGKETGAR